ncbi:MAG: Bro-N domain-containing protein [Lachnospiraceae bacterium]|nr:Bro-N domain-containing protein [Lachnospiraceae bacterium]
MIFFFFYFYDEETDSTVQVPVENVEDFDEQDLEFFFNDNVRKVWHKQQEEWYFSVIDVCQVLTESTNPKNYWNMLKARLRDEGNETYTNCVRLKMRATDGKMRLTDCASTEQLLRIIQSIPSKKAEPFKQWLALVGKERLDEMADPEKAMDRAVSYYKAKGYSDAWITQRLRSIEIRKEMTDEWQRSGISSNKEYAALTSILTHAWSGKTVQQYKQFKGLHKENLRDNMTNTELALNLLAEVSTTELSKNANPQGFSQSKDIAKTGGSIAGNARKELEKQLGRSVISPANATTPKRLDEHS